MTRLLLLLIFCGLSFGLSAQNSDIRPCATEEGRSSWLDRYQAAPQDFAKSDDILYVPAAIHVVGTDEGVGYFSLRRVWTAFCKLNQDLAASNIQLYLVHPLHYINETDYYDHENYGPGYEMMDLNNFPNVVNSYIVDNPAGACGYYNGLGVALNKGCANADDNTWAHEMGHYFQLPHTFLGWGGVDDFDFSLPAPEFMNGRRVERVDGQFCGTASDGFCDTPPDYLSNRWTCNDDDESSTVQTDPDGETFRSDGTFFMSYALNTCRRRFSDEQNATMQAYALDEYGDVLLSGNDVLLLDSEAQVSGIAPINDELVPYYNEVTLEWEPVEGAFGYHVQVTFTSTFAVVTGNYMVYDANSLVVTDLGPDNDYYWRVRPIGHVDACAEQGETYSFLTSSVTNTQHTIPDLDYFTVQPNPVSAGQHIRLNWSQEQAGDLDVIIYNPVGQRIHHQQLTHTQGNQTLEISTENWPAGIYMAGLQQGNGTAFRRVVVR